MNFLRSWIESKIETPELKVPLVKFSSNQQFTLQNAFEGTLILGSTGSGKTSGSGNTIAQAFLKYGFSGLVLCVKPEEPEFWLELCKKQNRLRDVVMFSPENNYCFNPLEQERDSINRVELLFKLAQITAKGSGESKDPYWINETRKLLINLFELVEGTEIGSSLFAMEAILASLPQSSSDTTSASWKATSACWKAIDDTSKRIMTIDLQRAVQYFTHEYPSANIKSRAVVTSMTKTTFETLLRGDMRKLFTEKSTISPDAILTRGKIVIVNLPVQTFHEAGVFANLIWKYCFQRAIGTRSSGWPTFIWADEAQYLLIDSDATFQTTARSKRCATVYLTQNLPGIKGEIGITLTENITANLKTKIFHQNDCPTTNDWADKLMPRISKEEISHTVSGGTSLLSGPSVSTTTHWKPHPKISLDRFPVLKNGTEDHKNIVEAVVIMAGGGTSSSRTAIAKFHQKHIGSNGSAQIEVF